MAGSSTHPIPFSKPSPSAQQSMHYIQYRYNKWHTEYSCGLSIAISECPWTDGLNLMITCCLFMLMVGQCIPHHQHEQTTIVWSQPNTYVFAQFSASEWYMAYIQAVWTYFLYICYLNWPNVFKIMWFPYNWLVLTLNKLMSLVHAHAGTTKLSFSADCWTNSYQLQHLELSWCRLTSS